jgi:hypothetical protein
MLLNFSHKKLIGIHLNLFENNSISDKIQSKKEGNYNDPFLIDL